VDHPTLLTLSSNDRIALIEARAEQIGALTARVAEQDA